MRKLLAFLLFLLIAAPAPATVNTTANTITYTGNGATVDFSFPFPGVSASDLVVQTVVSGVTTTLNPSTYTVTLNAPISPNPTGVGGNIHYPNVGSPLASPATITITRTLPAQQNTSLAAQGTLYPPTIEQSLDYLTMLSQQSNNSILRAITAPATDPNGLTYVLPSAAQRANTALIFDSSGNVTTGTIPSGGTISSAMQPVVSAATLALGRTAFGLGSMAVENINGGTCGGASLQDDGSGNARVVATTTADSINTNVTCAFHLTQRIATGPFTYTLPRANTLFNGFVFYIYNVPTGGTLTITPNANDNFVGLSSGTSITLLAGHWTRISTNAAASGVWYVTGTKSSTFEATDFSTCVDLSGGSQIWTCRNLTSAGNTHDFSVSDFITFSASNFGSAAYDDQTRVLATGAGINVNHHASYQSFAQFNGPGTLSLLETINSAPQVVGGTVSILAHLSIQDSVPSGGGSIGTQIGVACPRLTGASNANWCLQLQGPSDLRGHMTTINVPTGTSAPTLTSCGSSPSLSGNDLAGVIVTGTGSPTGCTLNFGTSWATAAPACLVTWGSGPLAAMSWNTSTSALTITQTGANNTRLYYSCWGTA